MEMGLGENGHMRVLWRARMKPPQKQHRQRKTGTYVADNLALHEDAHRHMQAEELSLHLELHVILRRLPLHSAYVSR